MSLTVVAPVAGRIIRLSDVPDPVFSAALVGPGVAIDPAQRGRGHAVAPIDGTIAKLHPHAYVITSDDGAGVLVHLGIDTVQLAGKGFELLADETSTVAAGDPIVAWDPAAVVAGGRSPICPIVALDAPASALSGLSEDGDVAAGETLFTWER